MSRDFRQIAALVAVFALGAQPVLAQPTQPDACTAFEDSQERAPAADTLRDLAGCYVTIGKLASAWAAYRQLAQQDPDASRREDAARQARALAPRLPKLVITAPHAPADLLVQLNGIDVTRSLGIDNPVDLGHHEVVARASGFAEARIPVEITEEGKTRTIVLALAPLTTTPVTTRPDSHGTPLVTTPLPPPTEPSPPHSNRKRYAAIIAAAGLAVLATGIVLYATSRDSR